MPYSRGGQPVRDQEPISYCVAAKSHIIHEHHPISSTHVCMCLHKHASTQCICKLHLMCKLHPSFHGEQLIQNFATHMQTIKSSRFSLGFQGISQVGSAFIFLQGFRQLLHKYCVCYTQTNTVFTQELHETGQRDAC